MRVNGKHVDDITLPSSFSSYVYTGSGYDKNGNYASVEKCTVSLAGEYELQWLIANKPILQEIVHAWGKYPELSNMDLSNPSIKAAFENLLIIIKLANENNTNPR